MKFEFNENKWGVDIELIPETPAETAQLLRFANNAKKESPTVYLSFSDIPKCYVSMMKVKETVQINSISARRRK